MMRSLGWLLLLVAAAMMMTTVNANERKRDYRQTEPVDVGGFYLRGLEENEIVKDVSHAWFVRTCSITCVHWFELTHT